MKIACDNATWKVLIVLIGGFKRTQNDRCTTMQHQRGEAHLGPVGYTTPSTFWQIAPPTSGGVDSVQVKH